MLELTNFREAVSKHQQTNRLQKRTFTSNTALQGIHIYKQYHSKNLNTAFSTIY